MFANFRFAIQNAHRHHFYDSPVRKNEGAADGESSPEAKQEEPHHNESKNEAADDVPEDADDDSKLSLRTVRHKLESAFAAHDRCLDVRPFVINFETDSVYGCRAAYER